METQVQILSLSRRPPLPLPQHKLNQPRSSRPAKSRSVETCGTLLKVDAWIS
jgi:hypothetical protein